MLWEHDGLTQKEIGKALNLKPPTVTVMLKRMENAGFLERRPDSKDMRLSRVYLTDKGRNARAEVENVFKQLENECFDGFTMEERILLRRFFIQIRDNLCKVNGSGMCL
jgi:DNA-binding MarR family transcriptional regulator